MKKNLKNLTESGWKISKEDETKIVNQRSKLELNKSMLSIAESTGNFSNLVKEMQKQNSETENKFDKLLVAVYNSFESLLKSNRQISKKEWEFDVKRNKGGFISKVFAKEI